MPFKDKNPALQGLLDAAANREFGLTVSDAIASNVCVKCHEPAEPKCYSVAGKREYQISGLCEQCFDEMFKE